MSSTELRDFFATTPLGIETLLGEELTRLGATALKLERAGVSFRADLPTAYRICLWSRLAGRVLMPIARFSAPDAKKLYGGMRSIRWNDHLEASGTFSIAVTQSGGSGPRPGQRVPRNAPASIQSAELRNTHFVALKAKDAIVDQFRSVTGTRPDVRLDQPDLRVQLHLENGEAIVSIDLSGDSLHRRGYRADGAKAPLKENLAAAILELAGWRQLAGEKSAFVDLMCGSGTLAIEAALMASNTAPGFFREHFGFSRWKQHDSAAWKKLRQEAMNLRITDKKKLPRFFAFDADYFVLKSTRENVVEAMCEDLIHIEKRELKDASQLSPQYAETGLVGLNPPYGERLDDAEKLKPLYRLIGNTFKKKAQSWKGFVFTGNLDLAKEVGLRASRRHVLHNGAIECRLLCYEMYAGSRDKAHASD